MDPNAVLRAVERWISEGNSGGDSVTEGDSGSEGEDEGREDGVRGALASTKTLLTRNIEQSPSAHLAWVAASLCIQRLVEKTWPGSQAPGLAYIVARIGFYDRLSQLTSNAPQGDEEGDGPLREGLVDLYTAVLRQLIVALALGHVPHATRTQQQKEKMFDHPNVAVGSAGLHPVIALELSLGQHARDKALEESIAQLVRLRVPDSVETASDTMIQGDGREGDREHSDTNDEYDVNDTDEDGNDEDYRDPDNKTCSDDAPGHDKIQESLCVAPARPPSLRALSLLPLDLLQGVYESLYHWACEQDAYRRWRKACSAGDAGSDDRILWLHGPEGPCMTMLLDTLAKAETENGAAEEDGGRAWHTVARASWDWFREVNGTSVVSVLRDLVWGVLAAQPTMQKHLGEAVRATGRGRLLGGGGDNSDARYALLGTSCDFYAMLALLCRIVGDPEFEPTCFVVDYMGVLLDDDDGHVDASTAQKRAWTPRDLVALVRTTCGMSDKVAWIMSSSPLSPVTNDVNDDGGCHLRVQVSPPDDVVRDPGDKAGPGPKPGLSEIINGYVRALLQSRPAPTYTPDILDQLARELTHRAGGNVAWSTLVADVLAQVCLPWNAIHVLQRLPDSSEGLGSLMSWIVQDNVSRNSDGHGPLDASVKTIVDAVLYVAALAFRPLTVPEMAALAEVPATMDAAVFISVLARPLLELRDGEDGSAEAQKYVYFLNQAVLSAQRARLAKTTAAPNLHADMACRHLRHLACHYGDAGRGQVSPYMKLAWLRHLDRVDIGRTDDLTLTDKVCKFVERNAGVWLLDLEGLGIITVARGILLDLLPPGRQQLSPIQAALETLLSRIERPQALNMSLADTEHFRRIAGCNAGEQDNGDDLPVLPQTPAVPLPDSPKMAEAESLIATLEGHTDWVRDMQWAYDGRLIVSISDDDTLRCWDRASFRLQHVTEHTLPDYPSQLAVSRKDTGMIVAMDNRTIVQFDLASGALAPITTKSCSDIIAEWRKKHNDDDDDEELTWISYMRFAEDASNDITLKYSALDHAHEVVLGMPGLHFQKARRVALGYKNLPADLADVLSESDCKHVVMADNVELAAVVRSDGDVVIYNTRLAEKQQTLHWAQSEPAEVRYISPSRVFLVSSAEDYSFAMFHFVKEREEQHQQGQPDPTKPAYKPLIRSYRPPQANMLSYAFSHGRDEVVFTYRSEPTAICKVVETDADGGSNAARVDSTYDSDASSMRGKAPASEASEPFTSTLLSHGGLRVVTSNNKGQVQLWDLPRATMATSESEAAEISEATLRRTMESTDSEINWLSFSSDDAWLLTCYDNGETDVWDVETGERVAFMGGHSRWVRFAAFSSADDLVATASFDGLVRLWDLKACRQAYKDTNGTMDGYFVEEDSMSEDNKSDQEDDNNKTTPIPNRIFLTMKGAAERTPGTVAFSPDGRFLVTSGRPGHIWDISPDPASNNLLPTGPLVPCATLCWEDITTRKRKGDRKSDSGGSGNEDEDEDEDDDDTTDCDDDDDTSNTTAGDLDCYSFRRPALFLDAHVEHSLLAFTLVLER
ncbi:hypothetical protein KVR01_013777 [Diaporthe batatas]|uniref:uncharacterized protein n=1 Tax=Diaporthe batatas TaxID=748121 RepID=UPI001D04B387|nr:uncharacterized protein KVR01_013777 [Diaporthe batatas]KAG8156325.1 hypothetical protein KVR01_013777 [Diaporthe batatas]